ncbi:N-acetylmuramoyl-L-alanine amidase [Domibacillus sp. DTU_2020_1001157_1_SI_ALB_TIR_016]|uniref:N-acetylmuramoyl-L-alanine amidase n=1 Tax=Domibacillus sp. DTU_2020_1001157_1_SI_ALB_TIR_016 TaxID=3077789 RepID=UPI0028EA100F|nr:N-acetylmuramoyl-L-alanine amidase [Domibacillus sp. DTU_2020_1001157_1_SI_ALB_TIR_016]WNS81350.1 N-acetylmuramoyl-L-alanine amidase [Domibacillus sp. DTU_2020_1001157_1_SI_ALB_TIR_016]
MKIAIDAGHGPATRGKRSPDGMKEFEFNRATALFLRDELPADTLLVHDDQIDLSLRERVQRANQAGADLYVSIHANAFGTGWTEPNGIETYVCTSRPPESMAIAQAVQRELVLATGRRDRGVKTADFYVLRKTIMPAILIEAGFMTHKTEASLLQRTDYRKTCARAIASAIRLTCM